MKWKVYFYQVHYLIRYVKIKEYVLSFIKNKDIRHIIRLWNIKENKKMLGNFQYGSTSEFKYRE